MLPTFSLMPRSLTVAFTVSLILPSRLTSSRVAKELNLALSVKETGRAMSAPGLSRPTLITDTPLDGLPFWLAWFWSPVVLTAISCRICPETSQSAACTGAIRATSTAAAMTCRRAASV